MGKYFGRQPRYSREEAEAQAKQAIDAAVSRGRPPAEDWAGLQGTMGEINQELATRPRVDLPPPPPRPTERRPVRPILRPPEPAVDPQPIPAPAAPVAPKPAAKKAVAKSAVAKKATAKATTAKKPAAAAKATTAKRPPAKKRTT